MKVVDQVKLERRTDVVGKVLQVAFVIAGQDDLLDPGPTRAEHLLLDSADREHAPGERDLTRHRDVVADRVVAERRYERDRHRDARRRSFLRHRPGRHMHVDLVPPEAFRGYR